MNDRKLLVATIEDESKAVFLGVGIESLGDLAGDGGEGLLHVLLKSAWASSPARFSSFCLSSSGLWPWWRARHP